MLLVINTSWLDNNTSYWLLSVEALCCVGEISNSVAGGQPPLGICVIYSRSHCATNLTS